MADLKWIKISLGMFDDEKIRVIKSMPAGNDILMVWIQLLVLAGKKNCAGEIFLSEHIMFSDNMLSEILHEKVNTVRLALKTFVEFGMIDVESNGRIVILNWSKHQNLDALERHREYNKVRNRKLRVASRDATHAQHETQQGALGGATVAGIERREKIEDKESTPLPLIEEKGKGMGFEESKEKLSELFGRQKREWSYEENRNLSQIIPIEREFWPIIEKWFKLPRDHPVWEVTMRRQTLSAYLDNFHGENDKIRSHLSLFHSANGSHSKPHPRWREFMQWRYNDPAAPELRLPDSWEDLPTNVKAIYHQEFAKFEEATKTCD